MPVNIWGRIRFGCKIAELILSLTCFALFMRSCIPIDVKIHPDLVLIPVTFGGFILVSGGLIVGFATGNKVPKKVDLLYTFIGMTVFVSTGSLLIDYVFNKMEFVRADRVNATKACAILAFITSVFFLGDIGCSYKDVHNGS